MFPHRSGHTFDSFKRSINYYENHTAYKCIYVGNAYSLFLNVYYIIDTLTKTITNLLDRVFLLVDIPNKIWWAPIMAYARYYSIMQQSRYHKL